MLEGLVAGLLNRFLGMYVKNFDAKQLNVGIWSGDVKLRDLQLRREALDQLHLPVNVVEGHLGHLTMSIPWSNLRGKPVRVSIEDVFLLAAPKEDAKYDEEEEQRRAHDVKMEKLENAELLKQRNSEGLSQEEQQKSQSFTESLTTAIVDNLQVSVKNIHIRYEDAISTAGHPFALGLTLREFSAVSTDKDWRPSYIQSTSDTTHKLAVLGALAFYWDTDTSLFGTGSGQQVGAEEQKSDRETMIDKFTRTMEDGSNHQYMLKPVSGRAAIEMDKSGKLDKAKIKARLLFQELGFCLDDQQYRDALMMVDLFHYFIRHQEYKKLQPPKTPKEDPHAWLRFAFQAVLSKIQERNRQWTWGYIKARREDRKRYIHLFKEKKKEAKMSPTDTEELNALERKLTYEDLRFWRSLARNQLRKENVGIKKPAPTKTWTQWAFGGGPKTEETVSDDSTMSEEQRKELYNAIDWDEKKSITESIDMPRESVKLQVESSLQTGSFTLKRDPHGHTKEIMSLMFDNFQAKALQRPDSFLADLSLGGMRINDGTTDGSLFPQIVNFKAPTTGSVKTSIEDVAAEDKDPHHQEAKDAATDEALFHLVFEQNPLDESADSALTMKLKSLEVTYNPQFIVEVAKFFKPPERHMESIGALLETAGATVEGIRQQTRAGLEFALEEHKTLNANLDIQAPLIIIPESITKESALCLILDAGHVSLNSELVDKATMRDIQSKQKKQYSEDDFKQLEGLMYDKFLLKLESTQLLLGPGIQATKEQLNATSDSKNLHIVDRINMDFVLETSIIPKASDLTKTRISGHLPVLHASISDKKYKNLMTLIDIAIPKFDTNESLDGRTAAPTADSHVSTKGVSRADEVMGRQRSKSTSAQKNDLEMADSDDETVETRPKGSKRSETEELNIHQRNFEFKFTVDKLQGSLYRSDAEGHKPDQLLVELVADHFQLDFYQRPFDMVAEVLLKSLNVDDYIEDDPRPEFKKIISSKGFGADEEKDLFNIKFVKVNRDSPEFESTYESIATNLDVSVSTLSLVVTRKTLLTLLDFVLLTFAAPEDSSTSPTAIEDAKSKDLEVAQSAGTSPAPSTDKIRIKADLESVALILNNDGIRLATLTLSTANVGVFLSGGTMRIGARLGNLSLVDDINQGAAVDSPLRQLVTIQGQELADFKYQTFDKEDKSYPGYDTKIFLRSGSIKVNFLEEPFRKIINFLVKFGKMQAIFNAARQAAANQASHLQESANKMHFDVLIKTPILIFPRVMMSDQPRDLLTAYLGEIYASNEFVTLDTSIEGNHIAAGIRNVRLTSSFHYEGGRSEELEMIDKVDLDFQVTSVEHQQGLKRPDLQVVGKMSSINLRVAQTQLKFLMELSRTVPAAFVTEPDAEDSEIMSELPRSTVEPAKKVAHQDTVKAPEKQSRPSHQGPELEADPDNWTKIELVFDAPTVALELLLAKEQEPVRDLDGASLSKFALNDTKVKFRMKTDDSVESELLINSFTITDSRKHETNKFRKIMSLINDDVKQQFMASITMTGGVDKHMIAMLTVDSPRIIMAIDYLLAVQAFVNSAFLSEGGTMQIEEAPQDSIIDEDASGVSTPVGDTKGPLQDETTLDVEKKDTMSMSFRVNVIDAQVILIANPTISHSEAIVLGTKQVLVSQQNASTLQVTKVGMFLCRMDKFETSRLRILDDFSITMSMDSRSQSKKSSLTSISVDVEPLVLRLSLRDILLALQIVNKASEMSSNISGSDKSTDSEPTKITDITKDSKAPTTIRKSVAPKGTSTAAKRTARSAAGTHSATQSSRAAPSVVMKREEMTATIEGIRVILIGDLHELPLIDWSVKRFNVDVRDWSSAMTGDTSFDTYVNVYNFSKSAWEPLIEPWQLGFHVSQDKSPDVLSVEVYSHKMMELTVTSATIALASKSAQFLQTDEDVLSKPRGSDAPYKIRNYTGFDLDVWAASEEKDDSGSAAKLTDGEEAAWRFEDPTTMREKLSPEGNSGFVGIKLEGSGFDSVERIGVNREGETLYNLKPRKDKVLHRLLVEVTLGTDNVKYITFRSPLVVENNTQIPVEVGVFSPEEGSLLKIEKIPPGEARPAPVGAAFMHSLVVRPDQGFGYSWSNERLFWKDLLKRPTRTITCKGESSEQSPPFYFQMNAAYDKNDPMTTVYPYMRIKLHAPIELQNLLPYDFKYRIYDKNTKKDWTNFLRKGGVSPVHVVELSHLLLLSVDMQDAVFKQSEFAVINSNTSEEFRREKTLPVKDAQGVTLNLKLHYYNVPDSGGAFKISVYSPYLILNQTGLSINIQSKSMFSSAKSAAGQGMHMESADGARRALPYMFSFPSDDRKNRANLKVGDSSWSKPQSLDAIGSAFEVVLPSPDLKQEMHIGVSVTEGAGKYNLTKVATVAPRFIVKNKLKETLNIREPGSSDIKKLKSGDLLPLHFLKKALEKQLCLCFPGVDNQWSSPFNISNVGTVHIKLAKSGQRQQLIRVEVIMEAGTIFLHISIETKHWPFSMRNESDVEFMFYQVNPKLGEDEEDHGSGWKPIRYRLPAKSIMPYAWDYPASKNKELVIVSNNAQKRVKLAEIGNLEPLKVKGSQGKPSRIIDVNIAANGPTQTLVLSNYKQSKSLYKQKSGQAQTSQASLSSGFEVKELESEVSFKAQLRLAGVGISLVNKSLKELLYITFREIELKYGDSKLYQTLNWTIKWIQIDNQLYGGIFPILLYPSVVPKTGKEMEAHPIFHTQLTRVKDDSYGVLYIKYATLLLQQMTLEVDEDFIFAMLDFMKVPGASWSEAPEDKLCDDDVDIPEPQQEQQGQDVYFELLHLQPMQLDLSFVRTERINAEDTASSSNPLVFFVNVMTMSIGNVNDAPLRLNSLMLENARVSVPTLMTNVQTHYTQEILRQVHIILGSADFLGNPVGLFNNVTSGFADIFYEPYQGLVMTDRPQELGIGIAKGASSFVKKSVFGFSDSMAKFTGSVSKGLAAATLDKEYQDQRRMSKSRNRPKHALYGVTSGGNAFASSMASGIGGLARQPLQGAEKEGLPGFMKGVGKGVLGLATKPAIGAFDLASNLAEGVRNTTTVFDQEGLDRVRLTRFIGIDGIVRPYGQREALGQFWLKTLDDGKFFSEDYIAHLELPGKDTLVMLTYNCILFVKMKRLKTDAVVKLQEIQTISKERTGMGLTLKGGVNGPFIPVGDEGSRNWFYRQIAVAVNAFNDKYNAKG